MKNITKIVMLGLLLIPFAAITMDNAFAETKEVVQCAGAGDANNKCFFVPPEITVNVGDTVVWRNDDSATHTVTSGDPDNPDAWGQVFDSGMGKPKSTFEHTFDTAGEYPYLCQVHPWMLGKVIVVEGMEDGMKDGMMDGMKEGEHMSGTNFDLNINPPLPFDRVANKMVTLSFMSKAKELEGSSISPGKIDHLDYKVIIMKDGKEIWSQQFHDHDGNLELQITPASGAVEVTGGAETGTSATGPYMVSGPIFMDNGGYTITAQVVGIEFNPLPSPIQDNFTAEVVPEFPITAIVPMLLALTAVVAVMRIKSGKTFPSL